MERGPHREDNWVATCYENWRNSFKKIEIVVEGKPFADRKAPCTAIWQQQPLSVGLVSL